MRYETFKNNLILKNIDLSFTADGLQFFGIVVKILNSKDSIQLVQKTCLFSVQIGMPFAH